MIKPLYEFDHDWRQRIVKMHLEMTRGGKVTGPVEGFFGDVYSIVLNNSVRTRLAAKCPRIRRFGRMGAQRFFPNPASQPVTFAAGPGVTTQLPGPASWRLCDNSYRSLARSHLKLPSAGSIS